MLSAWSRLPKRIDRDWFAREQRDLVAFANEPWARRFLTIDQDAPEYAHLPIVGLWGNAAIYRQPSGVLTGVFYSGDHFARRLHGFTRMVERGRRFGGLDAELYARIRLETPAKEALAWLVANTSTFNPDANPETTSVDGEAERNTAPTGETFATMRAGSGTTASDSASTDYFAQLNSSATNPNFKSFLRGIALFDTAALTAGAVLLSAVESLYVISKSDGLASAQSVSLVTSTPASNTAVVAADYSQLGSTKQATDVAIGGMTTSAYNAWTLNATGLAGISKTGVTKHGFRISADADNSAPSNNGDTSANIFCNTADNGSNKPKLVADFTLPGMFVFF